MLQVYTTPSCSSCRKVKQYFNKNHISFVEKNIYVTPLTREDIYRMLFRSENGFEDIVSTRSKVIKEKKVALDDMKIDELVEFIIKNPSVLKRPIIVAEDEIQVGYNDDDITLFLPPEFRDRACNLCGEDCEYQKALGATLK